MEKLRVATVAAFPAESEWETEMETVPLGADERSRVALHDEAEQVAVPVASPERMTVRAFSEQVPLRLKAL